MLHKVQIIGHVGRDAEMRYTPAGHAVANFSVAANRRWNNGDGEKQEETIWFRITTWRKLAEATNQYVRKGMLVYVEGRLNPGDNGGPRIWTDNEGNARASFEVTAQTVKFLSRVERDEEQPTVADELPMPIDSDDIPF